MFGFCQCTLSNYTFSQLPYETFLRCTSCNNTSRVTCACYEQFYDAPSPANQGLQTGSSTEIMASSWPIPGEELMIHHFGLPMHCIRKLTLHFSEQTYQTHFILRCAATSAPVYRIRYHGHISITLSVPLKEKYHLGSQGIC
jgi:hypothetical protein